MCVYSHNIYMPLYIYAKCQCYVYDNFIYVLNIQIKYNTIYIKYQHILYM